MSDEEHQVIVYYKYRPPRGTFTFSDKGEAYRFYNNMCEDMKKPALNPITGVHIYTRRVTPWEHMQGTVASREAKQ